MFYYDRLVSWCFLSSDANAIGWFGVRGCGLVSVILVASRSFFFFLLFLVSADVAGEVDLI